MGLINHSKCRFNNPPPIGTLGSMKLIVAEKSRLKFKFWLISSKYLDLSNSSLIKFQAGFLGDNQFQRAQHTNGGGVVEPALWVIDKTHCWLCMRKINIKALERLKKMHICQIKSIIYYQVRSILLRQRFCRFSHPKIGTQTINITMNPSWPAKYSAGHLVDHAPWTLEYP